MGNQTETQLAMAVRGLPPDKARTAASPPLGQGE